MIPTHKTVRVLVVDDHRDGADSLGQLVEALGSEVLVVYGGRKALEVVTEFRPDVMFVDLCMPDIDGVGLIKRLRQMPCLLHTKIVAVTGRKDEQRKQSALLAGFDDVFYKPLPLPDLQTILQSFAVTRSSLPAPHRLREPRGRMIFAD